MRSGKLRSPPVVEHVPRTTAGGWRASSRNGRRRGCPMVSASLLGALSRKVVADLVAALHDRLGDCGWPGHFELVDHSFARRAGSGPSTERVAGRLERGVDLLERGSRWRSASWLPGVDHEPRWSCCVRPVIMSSTAADFLRESRPPTRSSLTDIMCCRLAAISVNSIADCGRSLKLRRLGQPVAWPGRSLRRWTSRLLSSRSSRVRRRARPASCSIMVSPALPSARVNVLRLSSARPCG